ncbi:Cache domain-containing protein [Allopseudospirillum japonicum]|uniref:Cache domain-containing protein n=1 Tax=Allopseudospirillum japonicum TaxID=64971 RepID=A0A1H6SX19_9GAMM|nr:HD domain-containing phosphohydrolase [Allopseudospirillum japonicum]SEI71446.1 Cache domain-containing protein [Allopseudospirillum japonicum]
MKNKKYTFVFSILSLFGILTLALSIFLIYNFYNKSLEQAYQLLKNNNAQTTANIAHILDETFDNAINQLNLINQFNQKENINTNKEFLLKLMWEQLKTDTSIASIFTADAYGNFLQARREPELAVRYIQREQNKDTWHYKNTEFFTAKTQVSKIQYDPRTRDWYQNVTLEAHQYWSKPYQFASTGSIGITLALGNFDTQQGKKINVAAVDFTLDKITELLIQKSQELGGDLIIFNQQKDIIASSLKESSTTVTSDYFINFLPQHFLQNHFDGELIDQEGNPFVFFVSKIEANSDQIWYLASVISKKDVVANIESFLIDTVIFSLLMIALIYFPIHWALKRFVINPVHQLEDMTHFIANKEYEKVKALPTVIYEFNRLSDSMLEMSASIQKYEEDQKELIDSFVKILAEAIDDKSHYTGGHCERVPEIAMRLAAAASACNQGNLASFSFKNKDEWREFKVAAWLHDCGKIITPEHVVDKSTKLETIYNRIHEIRMRFEVLYRDAQISFYQALVKTPDQQASLSQGLEKHFTELTQAFEFVANANLGGEFMAPQDIEKLKDIATWEWQRNFDPLLGLSEDELTRINKDEIQTPAMEKLLADKPEHLIPRERAINMQEYQAFGFKLPVPKYESNQGELYNLSIQRGTLSEEDRFIIKGHMVATIKMLEKIPFTENLKRVPEYAGSHHETLVGTGYPRQLTREQLSIPARIMAIADVFEALTASDRPYKKAKTLSETLKIMAYMRNDQHFDAELFDLFLTSGIYKDYTAKFLDPEQNDVSDITPFLSKQQATKIDLAQAS